MGQHHNRRHNHRKDKKKQIRAERALRTKADRHANAGNPMAMGIGFLSALGKSYRRASSGAARVRHAFHRRMRPKTEAKEKARRLRQRAAGTLDQFQLITCPATRTALGPGKSSALNNWRKVIA